jgi:hypothetical protein
MSHLKRFLLFGLFGVVAVAVAFAGYSIPPCFGDSTGHISAECMARWESTMPSFPNGFVSALGVPLSAAVTFLVLTAGALLAWFVRRRAARRHVTFTDAD